MSREVLRYLRQAAEVALQTMEAGIGGPFGAIIIKDGEVIAASGNAVLQENDPTAHAEVQAIRKACRVLGRYHLDDCTLYATCEPCPMCLGAIYWARIPKVIYGSTRHDAENAGFIDRLLLDEMQKPPSERSVNMTLQPLPEALNLFEVWRQIEEKRTY
ncbi:MAG: nucleoside deaminase [Bacteroidia bacterium]